MLWQIIKERQDREINTVLHKLSFTRVAFLTPQTPTWSRLRPTLSDAFLNLIRAFAVSGNKAIHCREGGDRAAKCAVDFEKGKWISCPTGALEQGAAGLSGSAEEWDSCLAHVSGRRMEPSELRRSTLETVIRAPTRHRVISSCKNWPNSCSLVYFRIKLISQMVIMELFWKTLKKTDLCRQNRSVSKRWA